MKKLTLTTICVILATIAFSQELATRYNSYGQKVNRTLLTAEERDGILTFESKNQNYKFWFDNRVQLDGAIYFHDDLNKIGNGIALRRVRFAVKAQLFKKWYGEIDMQVAGGNFELEDAYLKFVPWDFLSFKAGNFKETFSMENTTTSRYLTFIERPMAISALAPGRHIGIDVEWSSCYFLAQGGVYFQEIKDATMATTVEDNNKTPYNFDQGMSYTGRFVLQPIVTPRYGFHIAYAASYRTPKTDYIVGSNSTYSWGARANTSINRVKYINMKDVTDIDHEFMQDIEAATWFGPVRLQGEYINNNVTRNVGTKLFMDGWYAQASMMLFGGHPVYDKSAGEFTQPTRGRKWGDIEAAFRYDYLNENVNDPALKAGSAGIYTLGLNYYVNSAVKFMFNYSFVNNDRYANSKGKVNVGYDNTGAPTKDPNKVVASKGNGGFDFNFLSMRFELDF